MSGVYELVRTVRRMNVWRQSQIFGSKFVTGSYFPHLPPRPSKSLAAPLLSKTIASKSLASPPLQIPSLAAGLAFLRRRSKS